jgi:hypothetical protein
VRGYNPSFNYILHMLSSALSACQQCETADSHTGTCLAQRTRALQTLAHNTAQLAAVNAGGEQTMRTQKNASLHDH